MIFCDLCCQDGEKHEAIACYTDIENNEWDVCNKHLKQVKKLKLEWYMI